MTLPPNSPDCAACLPIWPPFFSGLRVTVGGLRHAGRDDAYGRQMQRRCLSCSPTWLAATRTGLCYAEMGSRYPEASGGVAFVCHGFDSPVLAQIVGIGLTVTAASIKRGASDYLVRVVGVIGFTLLATRGVGTSVGLAAALGAMEIAGLLAAASVGLIAPPTGSYRALARPEQPAHAKNPRRQNAGRPDQGGGRVGHLKRYARHFADAGDQRHDAAQRAEKPTQKHAENAPTAEKRLAPVQNARMARQRPHLRDLPMEMRA
jgi:hypothetical protein